MPPVFHFVNSRGLKRSKLLKIIDEGESQTLDFKKTITHKFKIAKTLVSFANTRGGYILVGVMDDQQIIGVDPEEEKYSLLEASRMYCRPEVSIAFEEVEDKYGVVVLVALIEESNNKPHRAQDQHGNWNAYIRTNDKTVLASKMVLKTISSQSANRKPVTSLSKHERQLVEYLGSHERITLKEYARLVNISERRARRDLVSLTQEGWVFSHELEKEDYYTLA